VLQENKSVIARIDKPSTKATNLPERSSIAVGSASGVRAFPGERNQPATVS